MVEGIEVRPIRHHNFGNNRILRNYKARTDSRFAALNNVKSLNVAVNIQLIFIASALIGSTYTEQSETHN